MPLCGYTGHDSLLSLFITIIVEQSTKSIHLFRHIVFSISIYFTVLISIVYQDYFLMFRNGFVAFFMLFVVCSFCGKDFKSLGRHTWRCKDKLNTAKKAENVPNNTSNLCKSTLPIPIDETTEVSNCSHVKCCCGKLCNANSDHELDYIRLLSRKLWNNRGY